MLVCEDKKIVMKTLIAILQKEGYELDQAMDGSMALTFIRERIYDLILVDIHLPFHSGLEVINYLRTDLRMTTPVIILSAFSDQEMQRKAGELKIDDFIVKPFYPTELIMRIKAVLLKDR